MKQHLLFLGEPLENIFVNLGGAADELLVAKDPQELYEGDPTAFAGAVLLAISEPGTIDFSRVRTQFPNKKVVLLSNHFDSDDLAAMQHEQQAFDLFFKIPVELSSVEQMVQLISADQTDMVKAQMEANREEKLSGQVDENREFPFGQGDQNVEASAGGISLDTGDSASTVDLEFELNGKPTDPEEDFNLESTQDDSVPLGETQMQQGDDQSGISLVGNQDSSGELESSSSGFPFDETQVRPGDDQFGDSLVDIEGSNRIDDATAVFTMEVDDEEPELTRVSEIFDDLPEDEISGHSDIEEGHDFSSDNSIQHTEDAFTRSEYSGTNEASASQVHELKLERDVLRKRAEASSQRLEEIEHRYLKELKVLRDTVSDLKRKNEEQEKRSQDSQIGSKVSILQADMNAQLANRDNIILDLRRQVEVLEFDMKSSIEAETKLRERSEVLELLLDEASEELKSILRRIERRTPQSAESRDFSLKKAEDF